jgi:hypothetical protein
MGTGSFPQVKQLGCGIDHPPPSSTEVKERVKLYLYSLWAFVACSRVNITFTFTFTTKIIVVGAAHNNTKKNLNLRSSVTGLFNSDLRFQGQFSADGNRSHECWDRV